MKITEELVKTIMRRITSLERTRVRRIERIENLESVVNHLSDEVKRDRNRIDKLVIKSDPF